MKKILFIVLLATNAPWALANEKGNGGGGVVCVDQAGTVTSAKLLEFWEAKNGDEPFQKAGKLNIPESGLPVEQQISNALNRLVIVNPAFGTEVQKSYDYIVKNRFSIPENNEIPAPTDTKRRSFPKNCKVVGLGDYSDETDDLAYDENLLNSGIFSPTQIAGFWVHEAIYRTLRRFEDILDSKKARYVTAMIFSDRQLRNVVEIPSHVEGQLICRSINTHLLEKLRINGPVATVTIVGSSITVYPMVMGNTFLFSPSPVQLRDPNFLMLFPYIDKKVPWREVRKRGLDTGISKTGSSGEIDVIIPKFFGGVSFGIAYDFESGVYTAGAQTYRQWDTPGLHSKEPVRQMECH